MATYQCQHERAAADPDVITIPLAGRQTGVIVFNSKTSTWTAKITNPFNVFGRGPMESLGNYKDEDAARRAITYFSTICIGDKGIRYDRNRVNEEERLKVRIAALEIRLQNEGAKNLNYKARIMILEMQNQGLRELVGAGTGGDWAALSPEIGEKDRVARQCEGRMGCYW